jgi:hypothetical protein
MEPRAFHPLGHDDLFQGIVGLAQSGQDRMASIDDVGHISYQLSAVSNQPKPKTG